MSNKKYIFNEHLQAKGLIASDESNQKSDKFFAGDGSLQEVKVATSVTYSELVDLRDSNALSTGSVYRITDFITTVSPELTTVRSAGHQFDILVTADSSSSLSEIVRVTHSQNDSYFDSVNLDAWEVKYCLDNDSNRFNWADPNGKGVIWFLRDEWDNYCFYDFKNIQYKRWKVIGCENYPERVGKYLAFKDDLSDFVVPHTVDPDDSIWAYSFNYLNLQNSTWFDGSLVGNLFPNEGDVLCRSNHIDDGNADYNTDYWYNQYYLNNIVYFGQAGNDEGGSPCYNNEVKSGCFDITVDKGSNNTLISAYNKNVIIGSSCYYWSTAFSCYNWSVGNDCYGWSTGYLCTDWHIGNDTSGWTVGSHNSLWSTGNDCNSWSTGNDCNSWSTGSQFSNWHLMTGTYSNYGSLSDLFPQVTGDVHYTIGFDPQGNLVCKNLLDSASGSFIIDFQTSTDLVQMRNLNGEIKILKIYGDNIASIALANNGVVTNIPLSNSVWTGELSVSEDVLLVWNISRINEGEIASVSVKYSQI